MAAGSVRLGLISALLKADPVQRTEEQEMYLSGNVGGVVTRTGLGYVAALVIVGLIVTLLA